MPMNPLTGEPSSIDETVEDALPIDAKTTVTRSTTTVEVDGLHIGIWRSTMDQRLVVQIDTDPEAPPLRVNVNDAEVVTVENGGESIYLPEHWTEYQRPHDATLPVRVWTLTVDSPDSKSPATSVHPSEAELYAALRENHTDESDESFAAEEHSLDITDDADLITYLTEHQGFEVYTGEVTLTVPV